jgi:two-component system chemotaxis response regulator CheY
MKILTVDDSMLIRRIISSAAAVIGQESVGVSDGLKALEALRADPEGYHLICLDWNMPNMNGYECLCAIRADPRWGKIPILMVTTEGSPDSILLALKAGATAYLTKPFSEQDLQAKLMDCLGLGFD